MPSEVYPVPAVESWLAFKKRSFLEIELGDDLGFALVNRPGSIRCWNVGCRERTPYDSAVDKGSSVKMKSTAVENHKGDFRGEFK